jgi:cyanate permease
LAAGAVLMSASALLRAGAQSGTTLWFAVAVFGLGGPFISIGAPKLVTEWFAAEERGLAVGLYSTASSLGAITALVIADPLRVATGHWRWVMVIFAAVSLTSGLLWVVVSSQNPLRNKPELIDDQHEGLWRDPTVRRILFLAFAIFFVGHALNGWMPEMLRTGPWSTRGAAWLTAGGITIGVIGSLIIPGRVNAYKRPQFLITMFVAMAVCVWALAASSQTLHIFAIAVIGIVRVCSVPMAMLMLMSSRSVPDARMGTAGGLFFTAGELGGVSGPWVIGIARQNSADFGSSVAVLSVVAVISAISCWCFWRSGLLDHA